MNHVIDKWEVTGFIEIQNFFSDFGDLVLRRIPNTAVIFSPPQSYKECSMFSFLKGRRFLFTSLVFVLVTAFLVGCSTDSEDDTNQPGTMPNALIGKWVAGFGDSYEIASAGGAQTLKYDDGGFGIGYQGSIEFVSNYDSKSGVIIIKYTDNANKSKPNPFHAIYYLNLASATAEINSTWDATSEDYDADTATLNEAINKFTRGNMGNYIDLAWSTTYTKQ